MYLQSAILNDLGSHEDHVQVWLGVDGIGDHTEESLCKQSSRVWEDLSSKCLEVQGRLHQNTSSTLGICMELKHSVTLGTWVADQDKKLGRLSTQDIEHFGN